MSLDTRGDMAAVTVIANPLLEDQKVLLFQAGSPTYGLRVSSRDLATAVFAESIGTQNQEHVSRKIAFPGQLVSMLYKDFVSVYGITGSSLADLQVEMLSPVQAPVDMAETTLTSGALAACASGDGDSGWIYVLTKNKGKDVIGEWEISKEAPDMRFLDCPNFSKETSLYAVYDKVNKTRWLVYQQTDNTIVVYDALKKKAHLVDKSTKRAIAKTPLAAAIIPDGASGQRIVLYFLGNESTGDPQLYTANAKVDINSTNFGDASEQPQSLESGDGVIEPLEWAGLTTYVDNVPAAGRARILIYCLKTKNKGHPRFNVITHPFSKIQK